MEVVVIPRQLPEAIPIDRKGKGKAVDRQLQALMSEEEDDDDVPDSQDQIALMLLPNGGRTPTRKMASTPERKAPVAAAAFYSPSGSVTRKTVSSPNLKPQIVSSPSTKPVDMTTLRATRSTPAIEVSSPASATSSSRRSSRPAAAAATSAISTSYTSPFGTSRSARSTSSRQATPRASRSTSTIAAHKPKLTAAALASLSPAPAKMEGPPRTPRRERYMRSASGSPLSSLGPTPQKPKVKREMVVVTKEPDFFFDFEVHVRGKPTLRRERSQTLNELDASEEEDEDEMDVDEEDEDVVVSASGSKRKSPGSGRKLAHDGTLTGSESDSDSARDSADESDDDIVAAALARAKARREGGTALVTSDAVSAHPSFSNALAGPSSPDIRRSSRAIAKEESAALESERKKQERERSKMKSEMGLAGLASAGLKGKLGMVALQREREERESRGRGLAWEEGKRLLAMEEERGYVRFF